MKLRSTDAALEAATAIELTDSSDEEDDKDDISISKSPGAGKANSRGRGRGRGRKSPLSPEDEKRRKIKEQLDRIKAAKAELTQKLNTEESDDEEEDEEEEEEEEDDDDDGFTQDLALGDSDEASEASNPSSQEPQQEGPVVMLVLRIPGETKPFKLKMGTQKPFLKLKEVFCDKFGYQAKDVDFIMDGDVIGPDSTPEEFDLEDDDIIDVRIKNGALPNRASNNGKTVVVTVVTVTVTAVVAAAAAAAGAAAAAIVVVEAVEAAAVAAATAVVKIAVAVASHCL